MNQRVAALLLSLAAASMAGCGGAGPPERPCEPAGSATFGGEAPVAVCQVSISWQSAAETATVVVVGELPARGAYGSGSKRARLSFGVAWVEGTRTVSDLTIDADPGNAGWGNPHGVDARGDCRLTSASPRLVLACDLELTDGGRLTMRLDLPPIPERPAASTG